jgi:hypothetical protein
MNILFRLLLGYKTTIKYYSEQSGTPPKSKRGLLYKNVKVKVKLSLCLTKHHAMKMYWGVEVQLNVRTEIILSFLGEVGVRNLASHTKENISLTVI